MSRPHAPLSILWLKLGEDTSLPESLDAAARSQLDAVFDALAVDSPWSQALAQLGLIWPGGSVLRWWDDIPYVNGSAIATMISSDWVTVTRAPDGGYRYQSRTRLGKLPALVKSQWKIENFLADTVERPPKADQETSHPAETSARLVLSLKLGLALQALMLRLPAHEPRELASWLAGTASVPLHLRKTIVRLQKIQSMRTGLSEVWTGLFSKTEEVHAASGSVKAQFTLNGGPNEPAAAPAWMWDDSVLAPSDRSVPTVRRNTHSWQGLPVHSGRRTGRAWLIDLRTDPDSVRSTTPPAPYIAVFAQARPGAVEYYNGPVALVFGEGGVLSHACTVAREQSIPTVTAAGRSLIDTIRAQPDAWLTVDGTTGEVKLTESKSRCATGESKLEDPSC